ncbi:hypothetical protein EBR66_00995 [bacterium]|nr:hypothetical protein [bacterium]
MKEKQIEWFVEALSPEANEMIAMFLATQSLCSEASISQILCVDGISRNLWRIDSYHINQFRRARRSFKKADLRFFKRERSFGPVREASFFTRTRASKKRNEADEFVRSHE